MQATPLEVANAFAVFANGGFKVQPFYIDRIEGPGGQIVYAAAPATVCADCAQPITAVSDAEHAKAIASATNVPPTPIAPTARQSEPAPRVITPEVAFLMNDIMKEVITRGTGRRALALGRSDLRGKTGTTNLSVDTWFNGFNDSLVASVWSDSIRFRPLGEGEEGARTAVPIWVDFMREALRGVPGKKTRATGRNHRDEGQRRDWWAKGRRPRSGIRIFRVDLLPSEEGYVGDPEAGLHSVDTTSPDPAQSGADPIF